MQITAERTIKIRQLIVHGELFNYMSGGHALAILELASALPGIDAPLVNQKLLGGQLLHIAERLLKGPVSCGLLEPREGRYHLTAYGLDSLRERRTWGHQHRAVMAVGVLEGLAPGHEEDHHLHLLARVDQADDTSRFEQVEYGKVTPPPIGRLMQRLERREKFRALAGESAEPGALRTTEYLLLRSSGGKMFHNSLPALVVSHFRHAVAGQAARWEIEKVEPINQSPSPLKKLLIGFAGHILPVTSELELDPLLAERGFHRRSDGAYFYANHDSLQRSVIDVAELVFEQSLRYQEEWTLKIKGRLAAASPEQATEWYFARYFQADKVVAWEELRKDYADYARRAGQPQPVSDESLRAAFYAFASSPNRAAHSRRGFFLHFPR